MNYKTLLKQTWMLTGFFVFNLPLIMIMMMYFRIAGESVPVLIRYSQFIFLGCVLFAVCMYFIAHTGYKRRLKLLGVMKKASRQVIVLRKAVLTRIMLLDITGIFIALFYYLTGYLPILYTAFIIFCVSAISVTPLLRIDTLLNLTPEKKESMSFSAKKKQVQEHDELDGMEPVHVPLPKGWENKHRENNQPENNTTDDTQ